MADAERFLLASDVARLLHVNASALSNWKARGKSPLPEPAAYAGERPLYRLSDIRALIEKRHTETLALLDSYQVGEVVGGRTVRRPGAEE